MWLRVTKRMVMVWKGVGKECQETERKNLFESGLNNIGKRKCVWIKVVKE